MAIISSGFGDLLNSRGIVSRDLPIESTRVELLKIPSFSSSSLVSA